MRYSLEVGELEGQLYVDVRADLAGLDKVLAVALVAVDIEIQIVNGPVHRLGSLDEALLQLVVHMPLEALGRRQVMLGHAVVFLRMLFNLLVHLLQQLDDSNALGGRVLVAEAPAAIGADDELIGNEKKVS